MSNFILYCTFRLSVFYNLNIFQTLAFNERYKIPDN